MGSECSEHDAGGAKEGADCPEGRHGDKLSSCGFYWLGDGESGDDGEVRLKIMVGKLGHEMGSALHSWYVGYADCSAPVIINAHSRGSM